MTGAAPVRQHPPYRLRSLARMLSEIALGNVVREYPYAPAHVVVGPDDLVPHRRRHPAFYGAFDWHSAVHMHWLLMRLLRRHPREVEADTVRAVLQAHLTPRALQREAEYLRADPSFERPYGWAWLLTLAAECAGWPDDDARQWAQSLQPAVATVAELTVNWLRHAAFPVRDGVHSNSAFSLGLILDATAPLGLPHLASAVRDWAGRVFLDDRAAPAGWEPSGQDFLSPSLTEADLVRRLLPGLEFGPWLTAFLPGLAAGEPRSLLAPAPVTDRSDGLLGHLDGLNFSRAAALSGIAASLAADDRRRQLLQEAADRHLQAALPSLSVDDYASSHWLGSFAALALPD